MIGPMFPQVPAVYRWWARAVAGLVWNQWRVLDAQYAAGIDWLDAAAGGRAGPAPELQTLEQYALERVGKGLAPPREVYEAHNRKRAHLLAVKGRSIATDRICDRFFGRFAHVP